MAPEIFKGGSKYASKQKDFALEFGIPSTCSIFAF
ncbi:hypothetical protein CCACVL1_20160 [Corchorus capsularis]|uniref:Uncharacterized protein n=1 Tax=Corchorus capsularis TaxID=210143 RepID=A0A1R3HCA2_COCAP|nr:hypothetical protein CCACVL1_20160 [Corchorus capsularis]